MMASGPPGDPSSLTSLPETKGPQAEISRPPTSLETWIALGILGLILLVYFQVAGFQFVSTDDPLYLTRNPTIQGGLNWSSIQYAFTTRSDGSYLPMVWLSHAFCMSLFGTWAGGHHLVNLLLHSANALLLFFLLNRMTKSLWPSASVALLFALHPLHVESVAWVSERKDVLSTLFWLLTLWAYVRYVERPSVRGYVWMALLFVLGLLSKSMLVTLPLTLFLLDVWPLRRINLAAAPGQAPWKSIWPLLAEKAPLFGLSLGAAGATILASKAVNAVAGFPLRIRLGQALITTLEYLRQMVWPLNLSPYYPYPEHAPPLWKVGLPLVAILIISALCLRSLRRRPYLAVGWFWYLLTLLPVVGIIQVGSQAHADRYTYVPLIGIFIMLSWLGAELSAQWRIPRPAMLVVVATLLGGITTLTHAQAAVWKGSESLWKHALGLDPKNAVAHEQLGDLFTQEGRYPEAFNAYSEGLKYLPSYLMIIKAGDALEMMGQDSRALLFYLSAQGSHWENGKMSASHPLIVDQRIGSSLTRSGRFEEAEPHVQKVLQASSSGSKRVNLGVLQQASRIDWAIILRERNRLDESLQVLEKVVTLEPDYPRARVELGLTFSKMGRFEEALEHIQKASELSPRRPEVLYALGLVLTKLNRFAEAQSAFERLKGVDPKYPLLQQGIVELERRRRKDS